MQDGLSVECQGENGTSEKGARGYAEGWYVLPFFLTVSKQHKNVLTTVSKSKSSIKAVNGP